MVGSLGRSFFGLFYTYFTVQDPRPAQILHQFIWCIMPFTPLADSYTNTLDFMVTTRLVVSGRRPIIERRESSYGFAVGLPIPHASDDSWIMLQASHTRAHHGEMARPAIRASTAPSPSAVGMVTGTKKQTARGPEAGGVSGWSLKDPSAAPAEQLGTQAHNPQCHTGRSSRAVQISDTHLH
jgi:hypothetical protein